MSEPEFSSAAANPGAGLSLRQARERAGLHVAALAATLKVPVRQIEALEAGRYDEFCAPSYARALTASVCRTLKIDPGPILAQLPAVPPVYLGEPVTALNAPMPPASATSVPLGAAAPSWGLGVPAGLAFFLLLAAVVLWFVLPHLAPQQAAPVFDAQAPVVSEPPAAAAPLYAPAASMPAEPPPALAQPSASPAFGLAAAASAELAAVPGVGASLDAPTPVNRAPTLQLSAQQTAWVQVTGASGRVWLQRSLQPGESVAFDADWPLQLVVGRVDAVQATLQGQALDLTPHSRNNVARLQVRPSS